MQPFYLIIFPSPSNLSICLGYWEKEIWIEFVQHEDEGCCLFWTFQQSYWV